MAVRIAADIRSLIMSGEWEPNRRLPSTGELEGRYKTSNVTIQRALKILKEEKLLEGKAGSGVFVRNRSPHTIFPAAFTAPSEEGQPYRWLTEATKRNQRASNRIIKVAEEVPPKRVREALHLQEGQPAVLRVRVGLLDEEPAEVTYSYYPADLARGTRLADRRKIPGGTPTLLASLGCPPRRQLELIRSRAATQEEYELLEVPGDTSLLEVFRTVLSNDDRPVEATVFLAPAHLYQLGYELNIP
ncbi:GntR family transcriptional regulator [Streptomyces sp. NPDC051173]|uniref:GntR family transcriptional regulator n=1 Tax=Streptomyces sp. NPDC051173 TaxID=3155164 RepID=UPI00344B0B2B